MYAAMPCLSPCGTSTVAARSLSLRRRPLPSHRLSLLSLASLALPQTHRTLSFVSLQSLAPTSTDAGGAARLRYTHPHASQCVRGGAGCICTAPWVSLCVRERILVPVTSYRNVPHVTAPLHAARTRGLLSAVGARAAAVPHRPPRATGRVQGL